MWDRKSVDDVAICKKVIAVADAAGKINWSDGSDQIAKSLQHESECYAISGKPMTVCAVRCFHCTNVVPTSHRPLIREVTDRMKLDTTFHDDLTDVITEFAQCE